MTLEDVMWQDDDLADIVSRVCHGRIPVFCIVDAVDEAESPDILLIIKKFVTGTPGSKAKFIRLSRPAVEIERHMIGFPTIVMENENHGDIERIVDEGLASLPRALHAFHIAAPPTHPEHMAYSRPAQPRLPQLKPKHIRFSTTQESKALREIGQRLISHAQGSILWVKLVLVDLLGLAASPRPCTLVDLKQAAMEMPHEMKEYYTQMVTEFTAGKSEKDVQKVHRILMWICAGSEVGSVTLEMLWEAMALLDDDFSSSTMDDIHQRRIPILSFDELWRKIYVVCGPFLAIHNPGLPVEESRNYHYGATSIVQLMHLSVRDFLTEASEAGKLSFGIVQAREFMRSHLRNYLQIIARYFQREETDAALECTEVVDYLEERKLLQLALDVLQADDNFGVNVGSRLDIPTLAKPAEGSPQHRLASVLESGWRALEGLPFACQRASSEEDGTRPCGDNTPRLLSSNRLFYQACQDGSVTAVSNMLTLEWHKAPGTETTIIPYGVMLASSVCQAGRIKARSVVRAGKAGYRREMDIAMPTARAKRPVVEITTASPHGRPERPRLSARGVQVPGNLAPEDRGARSPPGLDCEDGSASQLWEVTISINSETGVTERAFYFKTWSEYLVLLLQTSWKQHQTGATSDLALRDDVEKAIATAVMAERSAPSERSSQPVSYEFYSDPATPTPSYSTPRLSRRMRMKRNTS